MSKLFAILLVRSFESEIDAFVLMKYMYLSIFLSPRHMQAYTKKTK